MKVAIFGGTGFIGKALKKRLLANGFEVTIVTRNSINLTEDHVQYVQWLSGNYKPELLLEGYDVFINLAGETINQRWTEENKTTILSSRVESVREILRIIRSLNKKPSTFISASAIGYYGSSETEVFTEEDECSSSDFLAETVQLWEEEALKAENLHIRTVLTRFGIVLSKQGGALPKMSLPFRLFAGGTLGNGKQWMSWIHIDDVVNAIIYCIQNKNLSGPVNVTAPQPVPMKTFGKKLSKVLKRPYWAYVPSFLLRTVLGEMSMIILEGQNVLPKKLQENGFSFTYEELEKALREIYPPV